MLEVQSVSKRFGGAEAVAEVSLKVKQGEIAGLIGPNGAGKTTLFNLIAGVLQPSSGQIRLNGADITRLRPYQRMALGIGRSFQIPRPFGEMTVLENMLTAAQRQSGDHVFGAVLAHPLPQRGAEADRKAQHLDPAAPRHPVVPELVEGHQHAEADDQPPHRTEEVTHVLLS